MGRLSSIPQTITPDKLKFIILYAMKPIVNRTDLIAPCGLYCAACKKFRADKCPGCKLNEKASWCKIRRCCNEKGYHTCAQCDIDVTQCKIHNNFIGKIFALLFDSDRAACVRYIREHGEEDFAAIMTREQAMTLSRKRRK